MATSASSSSMSSTSPSGGSVRWQRLAKAAFRSLTAQSPFVHVLRAFLCLAVWSIELGGFWPHTRRCRSQFSSDANSAPIQILVLTDPQIISTDPHPSYDGLLAKMLFPLYRTFTDRFLSRAWRSLRRPGGTVRDWTATVWLGDLTDMARLYSIKEGSQPLYDRFQRLFPDPPAGGSGLRNRTFYTPGNHDVTLNPHSDWKDPGWWKLYWSLQTREFSRWKFKHLFGTTVADLGWDAEPIYPPSGDLSHHLVRPTDPAAEPPRSKYFTKLDHTYRKSLHARIPLQVVRPDGSPPSKVAELILLDTTDIIALQRMGRDPFSPSPPPDGKPGTEADWRYGGAWWFLDELSRSQDLNVPRILFTHIPLWREQDAESSSCDLPKVLVGSSDNTSLAPGVHYAPNPSVHRLPSTRPRITPGTDAPGTYENLVGQTWSRFVLEKARPSVVFTGDDHDVCHHLHVPSSSGSAQRWSVPELTVPAMSLTSGVSRPGYARLALWPQAGPVGVQTQTQIEYAACDLPDQIRTWATSYPLLIASTFGALVLRKLWLRRYGSKQHSAGEDGSRAGPLAAMTSRYGGGRVKGDDDDDAYSFLYADGGETQSSRKSPQDETLPMTERNRPRSDSGRSRASPRHSPHTSHKVLHNGEGHAAADSVEFDYDVERLAPNPGSGARRSETNDGAAERGWRDVGHLSSTHSQQQRKGRSRGFSGGHIDGWEQERNRRLAAQFAVVSWPIVVFWLLIYLAGY